MPTKTGASHGLASFVTILIGATISNLMTIHSNAVRSVTAATGSLLSSVTGAPISANVAGLLVVATILSFALV